MFIMKFKEGIEVCQGWRPGQDRQAFEPTTGTEVSIAIVCGGVSGAAGNGFGSVEWGQVIESCNWLVLCSLRQSGAIVHSGAGNNLTKATHAMKDRHEGLHGQRGKAGGGGVGLGPSSGVAWRSLTSALLGWRGTG